jgi:mRNA-degrading endonuclease RelE of RelBE toxin-antitoxin system
MGNEREDLLPVFFTPEFKRNLRKLEKKYRHIRDDIQPIIDEIIGGETPGDQINGVQDRVFKVRAKNSDAARGKSGGYRMIYLVKADAIVLITLYSKTEQADVAAAEIRRIISNYESNKNDEAS